MGAAQEDATEVGGGTGPLGEVLSCGNTRSDVVWCRYLGVVGDNITEAGRISCEIPATGDKVEGKEDEGQFVAEGGGG